MPATPPPPARSVRVRHLALVAVALLTACTVSSSGAADAGHVSTRDAMEAVVRDSGLPGVLGQAEDGGGSWYGAYGVADRESGRPPLAGDRFRIGSVTKTFVAVVLLQLEAEGRLDLDDPVARHLPGVLRGNGYDGRPVTVRQLLRHTSGIPDFTRDPRHRAALTGPDPRHGRGPDTAPRTAPDLVRAALTRPPRFAPGRGWAYSNTNYVLAGMVIEAVTGQDHRRQIAQRLVRPLGLRGTTVPGASPVIRGRHGRAYSAPLGARPATRARPWPLRDVTLLNPSLADASGEMVSRTQDLVVFLRALLAGRLLPPRQLAAMTRTVATGEAAPADRYGLGLRAMRLRCGTTVWGHDGRMPGSLTLVAATRGGGHVAAFHVNGDWGAGVADLADAEFCD